VNHNCMSVYTLRRGLSHRKAELLQLIASALLFSAAVKQCHNLQ